MAQSFGEHYMEFINLVFEHYRIIISENNFTKYTEYDYNDYAKWAKDNGKQLVPSPEQGHYSLIW